jgi:HAD superfamily hydrolase (TIGR01459 family)
MNIINGLNEIIDNYEGLIIDLWGVIHDGANLYPPVLEAISKLQNKKIIFLSNGPFRAKRAAENLERLKIFKEHYKAIITSGEVVFTDLSSYNKFNFGNFGNNYIYIGPDRNIDLLNGLNYQIVKDFSLANFVLLTGFYNDDYDVLNAKKYLGEAIKYKLPLICANPDKLVVTQTGDKFLCAGIIAREYQNMGGEVIYYGKPYNQVYQTVFDLMNIAKDKLLAIGDSLETDIKGANLASIDSLLIASGIHGSEILDNGEIDQNLLKKLGDSKQAVPTYVSKFFSW